MVYTISGFNQKQLVEWKLDASDALIIKWFVKFMNSGKMATVEHLGETYYWVKYQAVVDELPVLGIKTTKGVAARFRKIAKSGLLFFHLKKNEEGTYSTFRLNRDQYKKLIYRKDMETKKPTGENRKVSPMPRKRKPKDSITNKTIIQNDDEANITLEDDSYNTMETIQHDETKEMNQEGFVPPYSAEAKYRNGIKELVEAYNKAALKAKHLTASPANISTFFNRITLNLDMLPLLTKHMDEWFRWNGRNNDPDKLGDRSISMLAYNLQPFYEHIAAIPTEEQISDNKKFWMAIKISGWSKDDLIMRMKDPLLEWSEEAHFYVEGRYQVNLKDESLVFPNGTVAKYEDQEKYFWYKGCELGYEEVVRRAKAARSITEKHKQEEECKKAKVEGELSHGGFMKESSELFDIGDDY